MQPYHLAKLVQWAGTLQSRKRLQKVVYLLQAAGVKDLDASYILHHYGPYSWDVASIADQLVKAGVLEEAAEANAAGVQYSYRLSEGGRRAVEALDRGPEAAKVGTFLAQETMAKGLLEKPMGELEHGATMVYFYQYTHEWNEAVKRTCRFKRIRANGSECRTALNLAREIVR